MCICSASQAPTGIRVGRGSFPVFIDTQIDFKLSPPPGVSRYGALFVCARTCTYSWWLFAGSKCLTVRFRAECLHWSSVGRGMACHLSSSWVPPSSATMSGLPRRRSDENASLWVLCPVITSMAESPVMCDHLGGECESIQSYAEEGVRHM